MTKIYQIYPLISVKMNGVRSRSSANIYIMKSKDNRKSFRSRKGSRCVRFLTNRSESGRSCETKNTKKRKTSTSASLTRRVKTLNSTRSKKPFSFRKLLRQKSSVNWFFKKSRQRNRTKKSCIMPKSANANTNLRLKLKRSARTKSR